MRASRVNPAASDPEKELPRSPSGRVPQWVIDERVEKMAHEFQVGTIAPNEHPGRADRRPRQPKPRRQRRGSKRGARRRLVPAICSALAIALIVAYYAFPSLVSQATTAIAGEQFNAPTSSHLTSGSSSGYPPRGVEARKAPLGTPATLVQTSDSYDFIDGDSKKHFVAYDPCRPIHYVTRPDHAPPGGQRLIAEAVAAASRATGLVFTDDGTTKESFSSERSLYQPARYGKRWAPVLIVWETPEEQPLFATDRTPGAKNLVGLGGSQAIVGNSGSAVFVTGSVQLNAHALGETLAEPEGQALVGGVIQHELGHVLGLGHVQDPTQLMYDHGQRDVTTYAAGDLAGLAKLGQGKCFPNH